MKKIYRNNLFVKKAALILLYVLGSSSTWGQDLTSFNCSAMAYQVTTSGGASSSTLYSYNVATGVRTFISALTMNVNAIGFNTLDNYLWGVVGSSNQVVKIGANGGIEIHNIPNLPAPSLGYNVGDFIGDGYWFVYDRTATRYYVIDTNPARSTYLQLVDPTSSFVLDTAPYGNSFTGQLAGSIINISDLAYSPSSGLLYGMMDPSTTGGNVFKRVTINPITGQVTLSAGGVSGAGIQTEGTAYGSVFVDQDPNFFYVFANQLGRFYKINLATNTASLVSTSPSAANNDGASCPNALLTSSISGSVFHDPDGGNVNNSTGNPNTVPSGLYANLVGTDGNVVAVSPVNSSGFYGFSDIAPGEYYVVLSTTNGTPGTVAPAPSLPTGWVNTGEFNGPPNTGNSVPVDGISPQFTLTVNSTDINFGIQQPPVADAKTFVMANAAFSAAPPAGYPSLPDYQSIPASSGDFTGYPTLGSLSGSDPEDCAGGGTCNTGTGTTFNIETINAGTQLYYDFGSGAEPIDLTGGPVSIPNFDVNKLVIYGQNGMGTSGNLIGFTYSITDKAGITSAAVPYTIQTESPLPVSLISFDVNREGPVVNLQWATSREENSKAFEIERSFNTGNWSKLGVVPSLSHEMGSTSRLDYHFTDTAPLSGTNYYRLKMIDLDGSYAYSPIRVASFEKEEASISAYPNPAMDELTVTGLNGSELIKILDSSGRTLLESLNRDGGNKKTLDIRSLSGGIYLINIQMPDGSSISQKMIKDK